MHLIDQFESYQTGGTYLQVRICSTLKIGKPTWSGAPGPLLERREKQSDFELVATVAVAEKVVRAAAGDGIETDVPKLTLDPEAPD